ncbi:double-stranded RNA-binding protein 1-like [Rhododendron vialii]|uniref:double-stranded RNA-binding protein 1-like n=1 Tax=Rhododendron vialii TaxID=182163 RepID=UPI00265DFE62|nr:double-stranded RNA-binding protein 1-like [Rhododendron vialii]
MYKTELNSLCQRKSWDLPDYSFTKCSPKHAPGFNATISGVPFTTIDDSTTLKEVENMCAKITFDHFSRVSTSSGLYKNRLQDYVEKRNLPLPEYSIKHEGPPHAIRLKSTVKIDGKPYRSPEFSPIIKKAKYAAAKVALESLLVNEVQEDDSSLFINLLMGEASNITGVGLGRMGGGGGRTGNPLIDPAAMGLSRAILSDAAPNG